MKLRRCIRRKSGGMKRLEKDEEKKFEAVGFFELLSEIFLHSAIKVGKLDQLQH